MFEEKFQEMDSSDYKEMQKLALEQLRSGKSLTGKGGVFAPLIKEFIETALEAEMEEHLGKEERSQGNKRNGKGSKTLKSIHGEIPISTPEDRHSTFEPQIIKKRETILADRLETLIVGLYGRGMSYSDISKHIDEMYDMKISSTVLKEITDRIIPEVKKWQDRTLEDVYPIVWLDAMHFKVKENNEYKAKAIYNVLALNKEGKKDLIGMYVNDTEGAKFWLQVVTNLKNRGVKDILIACTDNLTGFTEAIQSVFPDAQTQLCVIHQIRNSMKFVASKNQKEFMNDLKLVYKADTKEIAEDNLIKLEDKWGKKYPIVIESWNNNWENLSKYFDYDPLIRKLIYTTNAVEGFHRQVRKVTKTKGAFSSEMALKKLIYLVVKNISEKWTKPVPNWALIVQQLSIRFDGRLKLM